VTTGLLDLSKGFIGAFRIGAVIHHYLGPFSGQADGNSLPDTTAAASYKGDFVF
jgi:hypothetical protein